MRGLIAILCTLLLLPITAAAQDDDRGFLQGLIEDNLSSAGREVRIEGFAGALSSRATLEELTIADDQGIWLTLRGAVLDWNRSALFGGSLEVNELSADELIVTRLPEIETAAPSAEAPGFALPDLPVSIRVDRLAIGRAELGEALFGEAAVISLDGSVSLDDGAGEADLEIARLDGKEGALTLDAAFSNATQDLTLDLKLTEAPDGIAANLLDLPGRPSVGLAVEGTGTLADFLADIRLDTDGVTRLTGAVTLTSEPRGEGPPLRRFTADIGGDLAPVFTPQYRPFFGDDIQLVARGARRPDGSLNLEAFELTAQSLSLQGEVLLAPDGLPQKLALTGSIADPGGADVLLPVGADPVRVNLVDLEIAFDAARDDIWRGKVDLVGLDTAGLDAKNVTLGGSGRIASSEEAGNRVTADLTFQAQGLDLGRPEMNQALGSEIAGEVNIDWQQGTPVRLDNLKLAGAGIDLAGSGSIDIEGSDLAVTGNVALEVAELAPFSGLAGRDLSGAVVGRVSGSGALLGGAFDVDLALRGQDLMVSVPQIDPLLAGQSTVELQAVRDETGLTVERLAVQSPEVTANLSGKLASEDSSFQGSARLREVSLVLPELSGAVEVTGEAVQDGAAWQVDARASAPGGATVNVDGQLRDLQTAPVFQGLVTADVARLSEYAGLAKRDLAGSVSARISGNAALSGDIFTLDVALDATDLKTGIPQADAILAGEARLEGAVRRAGENLWIDRLEVQTPQLTGSGTGKALGPDRSVMAQARLSDVALVLPQLSGAARVVLEASEDGEDWQVELTGDAPGAAGIALDGTFSELAADPVFTGEVSADIGDLAPYSTLAGRDLAGSVSAQASGTTALSGDSFDLDLSLTSTDLKTGIAQADAILAGEARLEGAARRAGEDLWIDRLEVQTPQLTGSGSGKALGPDRSVKAQARLSDLALVLPQLEGPARFDVEASEDGKDWQVTLSGNGPGAASIALDGTFSDLASDPRFAGEVSADIGNLAPYATLAGRDLDGALTARAIGSARLSGESFDIDLSALSRDLKVGIPQADALLDGQATLDLIAERDENGIRVERLAANSAALTATASGALVEGASALDVDVVVRDASLLYPQMSGEVRVVADISEEAGAWTVDAQAQGPGGVDIAIDGRVTDPFEKPAFDGAVAIAADDLRPYSQLAGRPLGGGLNLRAQGRVDSADLSYDVALSGSSSNLSVGQAEADSLLAGTVQYDAEVSGTGTAVVIERLLIDAPQIDATVSGNTDGEVIDLTFDIGLADAGLIAPGLDGPLQATGTARQSGGRWSLDLAANGPVGSRATVSGSVAADFRDADLNISGEAPLMLVNRFITPNSLIGTLGFDLSLNGAPSLSALSGTVTVAGARAVLPGPGLVLEDINANVVLAGGRANVSARAAMQEGGLISLEGPVSLDAPYSANVVIRLADVVFTDPDLYRTTVSGELTATGPLAGGASLAGQLILGPTEVQIPSTGLGSTGDIPDITHINEPPAVRATRARAGLLANGNDDTGGGGTGPRFPIDVRIIAENQVFVRGRGLDAELGGSLRLTGTTADLVPSGEFRLIRGRLDILGKRLTLDEGIATLQGNFRPFIRLVASTEAGDVQVFIVIEGPANDPTISFRAEPDLPEDEVLAQLLFGRSIEQISPLQALQLASAVGTLAGRGGAGIIGTLRENFGLDDLDVTTDDEGNAALRVGKYIGENVYTDVTVGSESTEINLNLDISPTVTAKGSVSSDGNTSIGIFFQRDY